MKREHFLQYIIADFVTCVPWQHTSLHSSTRMKKRSNRDIMGAVRLIFCCAQKKKGGNYLFIMTLLTFTFKPVFLILQRSCHTIQLTGVQKGQSVERGANNAKVLVSSRLTRTSFFSFLRLTIFLLLHSPNKLRTAAIFWGEFLTFRDLLRSYLPPMGLAAARMEARALSVALTPALVMEMVCCSMASWMATWSRWSILSNSSIQHTPCVWR